MPRQTKPPGPPAPEPWPKELAVRRLKEAYDEIPELESLNHTTEKFRAWRENVSRILHVNWPEEHFSFSYTRFSGLSGDHSFGSGARPTPTPHDLAAYRDGLKRSRILLANI